MIAAVATGLGPHAPAGLAGEGFQCLRCDARPQPIKRTRGPLCVGASLIADGLQLVHTLLEHRIGHVRDSALNGVVQPLEFGFRLGTSLAQFGDMRRSALGAFLAAIKHSRQYLLKASRLQKAVLDVFGHTTVELFHRNGSALAAGFACASLGTASVVPVSPA